MKQDNHAPSARNRIKRTFGMLAALCAAAMVAAPATAQEIAAPQERAKAQSWIQTLSPVEYRGVQLCRTPIITELGSIDYPQAESVGSATYPKLCVFHDPQQAIDALRGKIPEAMKRIESQERVEPLSTANWVEYREAFNAYDNTHDAGSAGVLDPHTEALFLTFFDIFENSSENTVITQAAQVLDGKRAKLQLDTISEVETELSPSQGDAVSDSVHGDYLQQQASPLRQLNRQNEYQYAFRYAVQPNSSYRYYKDNDCTNFASQIRRAGGEPFHLPTWGYASGGGTTAWVNANAFSKFFGWKSWTSDHRKFSTWLAPGDFIGLDHGIDGSCDHIGFVVATGSDRGNYRDYQVAQHSKNYVDWVSSNQNTWEWQPGSLYIRINS